VCMLVDDRAGSRDLVPYLAKLHIPASLGRLEFGDVAFLGRGPGDAWLQIGVEYKSLSDVLSCITTGRLAGHQLVGMTDALTLTQGGHGFDVSWLLIEDIWQTDPQTGIICTRSRGEWRPLKLGPRHYMGRDLDKFLLTITQQAGVRIHRTSDKTQSAFWLGALYKWWTDKTWDEHKSLQTFDLSGPAVQLDAPSVVRRVAKELAGVGWTKSARVAAHFGSVVAMAEATEREWMQIDGIGKTLAHRIVAQLHGAGVGDDA
jgi:ERCC4-type nuclease